MEGAWAQVDNIANSAILAIYRKYRERRLPDRETLWRTAAHQGIADLLQEKLGWTRLG